MVAYLILGIHAAQFQGETALIQRARRRRVLIWYMSMQNMHLFSGMLFSGASSAPRVFLVLSAAGQARGAWVHYDADLIPAELSSACSEHLQSLSWFF